MVMHVLVRWVWGWDREVRSAVGSDGADMIGLN